MTSPETLRAGRNSYVVPLHGLIRDYARNPDNIFALVEGKDADYYRPRVASVFGANSSQISYKNIKGKTNEKLLIKAIKNNPSMKEIKFIAFFDRDYENDLSEISEPENYVTPGYSIENLYTKKDSFREIVNSLLFGDAVHDDEDAKIVDTIVNHYESMQGNFHKSVELFNHWAWVQRHISRTGRIDLDKFEVKVHCALDYSAGCVSPCYSLEELNQLAPERAPVTSAELDKALEWFKSRPPQLHFRGKQEATFLFYYLTDLIERASIGMLPFKKALRCSKRVSEKELISELGNYAETPGTLTEFLMSRKEVLCAAKIT